MAGTVKHARLESTSARDRLKRGRQPHWQALIEGRVHLGYQRWKGRDGEAGGRWLLRRYIGNGKYRVQPLGRADDTVGADEGVALEQGQLGRDHVGRPLGIPWALVTERKTTTDRHDRAPVSIQNPRAPLRSKRGT